MTRLCVLLLVPGFVACGGPTAPAAPAPDSSAPLAAQQAALDAVDPQQPVELVLTLPAAERPTLAPRIRVLAEAACAERGWPPLARIDVEVRCAGGQCTASARLDPPPAG